MCAASVRSKLVVGCRDRVSLKPMINPKIAQKNQRQIIMEMPAAGFQIMSSVQKLKDGRGAGTGNSDGRVVVFAWWRWGFAVDIEEPTSTDCIVAAATDELRVVGLLFNEKDKIAPEAATELELEAGKNEWSLVKIQPLPIKMNGGKHEKFEGLQTEFAGHSMHASFDAIGL